CSCHTSSLHPFSFNHTAPIFLSTLSLHDALPISLSVNPSKPTSWKGLSSGLLLNALVTCNGFKGTCPHTVFSSTGLLKLGAGNPFSYNRLPSRKTSSEIFPRLKYKLPPVLDGLLMNGSCIQNSINSILLVSKSV